MSKRLSFTDKLQVEILELFKSEKPVGLVFRDDPKRECKDTALYFGKCTTYKQFLWFKYSVETYNFFINQKDECFENGGSGKFLPEVAKVVRSIVAEERYIEIIENSSRII